MKKLQLIFFSSALIAGGWGCTEELIPQGSDCGSQQDTCADAGIVLGQRLKNPYSLENMRQAYDELPSISKSAIGEIKATHLYAKFIPKDSAQFAEIACDTTIFYYPFPLDYELEDGGNYYQEDGGYGYPCQYCVFEIGQKIPDVQYQVIDSCFIMEDVNVNEEADATLSKSRAGEIPEWKELEEIALRNAGIEPDSQTLSKKWTPYVILRYWDNTSQKDVPIEGLPVRCRNNLMISHQKCTDANGYSKFSKMSGKADYIVHWQRSDFKIRPNTGLNEAVTILKKNTKGAYQTCFRISNEWKYASIFRAVYYYYYKNIDGLSRPGISNLTIRACDEIRTDKNGCTGRNFISSDMHIYNLNRTSADIYGTVIHEMAHVAHRYSVCATNKLYEKTDDCIKDSWAVGVQKYLTVKVYPNYDRGNYSGYNYQYSRVVNDILERKSTKNGISSKSYYTIAEIEGTLRHARSWNEWKSLMKTKYLRNNEKYIDAVFDQWAADGR